MPPKKNGTPRTAESKGPPDELARRLYEYRGANVTGVTWENLAGEGEHNSKTYWRACAVALGEEGFANMLEEDRASRRWWEDAKPGDSRMARVRDDNGTVIADFPERRARIGEHAAGELARALLAHGRETGDPLSIAAGHIVAAVRVGLERGEPAVLKEMHHAAREHIRPGDGVVSSGLYVPIENRFGRTTFGSLARGFDMLAHFFEALLSDHRVGTWRRLVREAVLANEVAPPFPLQCTVPAQRITRAFQHNFAPSFASVATCDSDRDDDPIIARIANALPAHMLRHAPTEDVRQASEGVAEDVLRDEMRLSGWAETKIGASFKFLDERVRAHTGDA